MDAYLGKACIDQQVQQSTKKLIPHEDGKDEIAKNEGTGVSPWICPDIHGCEEEANAVERHYEGEEFPAHEGQ